MEIDQQQQNSFESSEPAVGLEPVAPEKITVPGRFLHGFEVLLVALGGNVVIAAVILLFHIDPNGALQDSLSVFYLLMGEAVITLILIYLILRFYGESLGFLSQVKRNWKKEIRIGVLAVPFLFLSTFSIGIIFQFFFPDLVTRENPLLGLIETKFDVTLFIISSLFVGGIKEEIQRAFVLVRFKSSLGGVWLGLVFWSAFFGFGHSIQGIDNAFAAGILGLIFGIIYIWRGNLVAVIVAHALFDICTVFAYWFFMRGL